MCICSQGSGGNIGVSVGADGILIVDDQFAPLADKIKAALKTLGEGKLKFVLNTHWHGDHTGGNVVFGPEAPIIAHDNVRKRLATEQKSEVLQKHDTRFAKRSPAGNNVWPIFVSPFQWRGNTGHPFPSRTHRWRQRDLFYRLKRRSYGR